MVGMQHVQPLWKQCGNYLINLYKHLPGRVKCLAFPSGSSQSSFQGLLANTKTAPPILPLPDLKEA